MQRRRIRLILLVLALGAASCGERPPVSRFGPPVILGLTHSGLEARVRGMVLLGELGCVLCHQPEDPPQAIDARRGPELNGVGSRIFPDYLQRFLANPHAVEEGTTMPDLLSAHSDAERTAIAMELAHYLRSFSTNAHLPADPDAESARRGRKLFRQIGCVACHAPLASAGAEILSQTLLSLDGLRAKYSLPALREFLLAPGHVRPDLRMPQMQLSPGEAQDIASHLLERPVSRVRREVAAPAASPPVDAAKVAAGRARFQVLGCANCHRMDDPERQPAAPAKPLQELKADRGCLSGDVGSWPWYGLSEQQRADIRVALQAWAEPWTEEARIRQQLAARNCIACHQRGEYGGVSAQLNPYFTSNAESLGQDGRLPPPLTGVGAKLQRSWLIDSIAHGQAVRPYLQTRMPGFGHACGSELAKLFAAADSLPAMELAALPEDGELAEELIQLGCELTGDKGMGCINCHSFAGESVGVMPGIDLVDSTGKRLRREWFGEFLRAPHKFRPGTLMPQFFMGESTTRPELGGGDAARQLDALWFYLAQGRNVKKPSGIRPTPIPLAVDKEAVILRRSLQHTGKRAISVGYPLGVNLSFDAERLGLNQIWWGGFVDAAGVWTGQGSGEARILSQEIAQLPSGPAFVVLSNADEAWPAATRRELGQRFLGYDLDPEQRPTFRYVCEDVTIADTPHELVQPGPLRPKLRRSFAFSSAGDKNLTFRAALDARVDDLGQGSVQVGSRLEMKLPEGIFRIRDSGGERELLVEIPVRDGGATLVIDYMWLEETR